MEACGLVSSVKLALRNSLGLTILSHCTPAGPLTNLTTWEVRGRVLLLTIQIQMLGFGMRSIVLPEMDLFAEYDKVCLRRNSLRKLMTYLRDYHVTSNFSSSEPGLPFVSIIKFSINQTSEECFSCALISYPNMG